MYDDYSQIYTDFGLKSEQKVYERVLFVTSIANDHIQNQQPSASAAKTLDRHGYFMFDFSC